MSGGPGQPRRGRGTQINFRRKKNHVIGALSASEDTSPTPQLPGHPLRPLPPYTHMSRGPRPQSSALAERSSTQHAPYVTSPRMTVGPGALARGGGAAAHTPGLSLTDQHQHDIRSASVAEGLRASPAAPFAKFGALGPPGALDRTGPAVAPVKRSMMSLRGMAKRRSPSGSCSGGEGPQGKGAQG